MSLDDDSSDEESQYSTTNVLLGYASKEPTGDDISFLGGSPSWLGETKPSYDLVQCKICKGHLSQLLQLNGELPNQFPTHDRRIHILACRRKACSRKPDSIRVLRAVRHSRTVSEKVSPAVAAPKPTSNLGNDIFGGGPSASIGANPFSKGSIPASTLNLFSSPTKTDTTTYATATSSAAASKAPKPPQPWPADIKTDDFPKLYLDADYESLDGPQNSIESTSKQIGTYQDEVGDVNGSSASAKEEAETFESSLDKIFQRFADRLAQNPEQVLRYEFKGNPLLYSGTDDTGKIFHHDTSAKVSTARRGIPGCASCGKSRVFEMQLTPHAIIELEGDDLSLDGMDWGSIIVGVCEADCQARGISEGDVGYLEEWAGIQWEERRK